MLRGGPKLALLKDRVNFEIMGANSWGHAPSLGRMSASTVTFYLTNLRAGGPYYQLSQNAPVRAGSQRHS